MVSTEIELEAATPGRAPRHRGDPQAGAGALAVRGWIMPHTE